MVITFSSLKGGVGKTTCAILLATNLAARGKKVLFYDLDTNNSSTMYFCSGIEGINEIIEKKNSFESLAHNKVEEYSFPTRIENIDIIPSSLNLDKLRFIFPHELEKTLKSCNNYDYVIIDTAPTYDNILINAIMASDITLTPIILNSWNLSTTNHLEERFCDELNTKINNWFLFYSQWVEYQSRNSESIQSQFEAVFENSFSQRILDVKIPLTAIATSYSQTYRKIRVSSHAATEQRLAKEINKLANMIVGCDGEEFYVEKF